MPEMRCMDENVVNSYKHDEFTFPLYSQYILCYGSSIPFSDLLARS